MKRCILGIDQSTQGTKALLFDETGKPVFRTDEPHRQFVDDRGWVGHDMEEVWQNVLKIVRILFDQSGVSPSEVSGIGISNQRETAVAWDRKTGRPLCHAIVWQCARAEEIVKRVDSPGFRNLVKEHTGLLLSPYFSAAKFAWILENVPKARELAGKNDLCLGTVDAYLLFRMTDGKAFKTDYSNASRTQLFNIRTLSWDEEILKAFNIPLNALPEVSDSDGFFGETDLSGIFEKPVLIHAMLGDSHAALYAQGCFKSGMTKCTYGTGSSVTMNAGNKCPESKDGIVTSLAWKKDGLVTYVLEGNINYTGAIVTWMKEKAGLIASDAESEVWAEKADPSDRTYLIPAFSGLGAPYFRSDLSAAYFGMSRTTGKAELVKAGLDAIVFQITDVVNRMKDNAGLKHIELRADGGPTKNQWLMQRQADILNEPVRVSKIAELSAAGVAFMAGKALGVMDENVIEHAESRLFIPAMETEERERLYGGWQHAVEQLLK